MVKKILIGVAVVVVLFLVIVALQPSQFSVSRSTTVNAPPAAVFAQVNDFRNWEAWSPWAKRDPNAMATFTGPPAGEGASFAWAGNDEVGEGQMTITESRPDELILIDLEFIKPFAGNSLTEFKFAPRGEQTEVTWTMSGHNNFISKMFCLFMDMDKMVGGDFEQGLASMKQVAEATSPAESDTGGTD